MMAVVAGKFSVCLVCILENCFRKQFLETYTTPKRYFLKTGVLETRITQKMGSPFYPTSFKCFYLFIIIYENKKLFLKIGTKQLLKGLFDFVSENNFMFLEKKKIKKKTFIIKKTGLYFVFFNSCQK